MELTLKLDGKQRVDAISLGVFDDNVPRVSIGQNNKLIVIMEGLDTSRTITIKQGVHTEDQILGLVVYMYNSTFN